MDTNRKRLILRKSTTMMIPVPIANYFKMFFIFCGLWKSDELNPIGLPVPLVDEVFHFSCTCGERLMKRFSILDRLIDTLQPFP